MYQRCLLLFAVSAAAILADTITFENQCPSGQQPAGPCSALFSTVGNAQNLSIATSIGSVMVQGGAIFDAIANLPADETVVYGTAGNSANIGVFPASGFQNPITITFPQPITGFFLDVLNGNTITVDYHLSDNAGNSADFQLAPNFSGGQKTIGFAATGSVVTISALTGQNTPSGITWDFLIDNVNFNTRSSATPEPATSLLIGLALVTLGLMRRTRITYKTVAAGVFATFLLLPAASPAATAIGLACPASTGQVAAGYSSSLAASGGVPPYHYSITQGALPDGLTLNPSTGHITGVPATAAMTTFTVKVVDSLVVGAGGSPDSISVTCSINIAPETWTQITDQYAVSIGQLDPRDPDTLVSDWDTGMVFVNFAELNRLGITGGYLQVLQFDPAQPLQAPLWVVQNLPVANANVQAGVGVPFMFGAPPAGPVRVMPANVHHTRFPVPVPPQFPNPPIRPPVLPNPPLPQFFPVRPVPATVGGLLIPPPPMLPDPKDVQPLDPKMERTDKQDALTEENSVEQRKNECAPASVANSLQYLKDKLGVDDKATNDPSGKPKSRVGMLDRLMGYNEALGTPALGILNGKKRYIDGANPTGKALPVTMNSQGRFCPGPSIDPACPGGQDGDSGKAPTEDFITKALRDKKDVEVCFSWPASPGKAGPPPVPPSPGGAHCVFVTGYQFVNGYLELECTHDLDQGKKGGVDWQDGGHFSTRVGILKGQLWIRSFFGRPALLTHVITEAPK